METQVSPSTTPTKPSDLQQQLCEAALYVSGRPLDLKTIGSVIGARSEDKIRGIATAVSERYRGTKSPIQVVELPDGRFVPLNVDAATLVSLGNSLPSVFQGFSGTLNPAGLAIPLLAIPSLPVLSGAEITTAAVSLNGTAVHAITNAITLAVQ